MRKLILALGVVLTTALAWSAAPEGYYDSLNGKKKDALKYAVKAVAHDHTVISYNDGTWNAFLSTDIKTVNGVDYWWDMYSDNLVETDGHSGLNIEHAVPNSWWGKTQNAAYKDLFHLNPSDAEANNRKSFYCLGEVAGTVNYDNGVTKVGKPASGDCGGSPWVFEPLDKYKGDFARAYMYIFTIYDTDCNWKYDSTDRNFMFDGSTYPTLRQWAYEMLVRWNELDPVDEKERNRNEAIYEIQGNRNPFIDYPELAQYIWGDKTTVAFYTDGSSDPGVDPDPDPDPDPVEPTPGDYVGAGTIDNPYTVADIIKIAEATGEATSTAVYFKGYVTEITEINTDYGNATFYIADEPDGTPTFLVYRMKDVNGAAITNANRFKVGDFVVVYSPVTLYKGTTPETVSQQGQLVSVSTSGSDTPDTPELPDDAGTGTEDDPYEVRYVKATTDNETGVWVEGYIAGYVTGQSYDEGCNFSADIPEGSSYNGSNVILAPYRDCSDKDVCIPIQFPGGTIRNELGLNNHPEVLQGHYKFYGNIQNYFSMRALKSVSQYVEIKDTDTATDMVLDSKSSMLDVRGYAGRLVVVSIDGEDDLRIVDLSGRTAAVVASPKSGESVALPGGFYVVCSGNAKPVKVLVR